MEACLLYSGSCAESGWWTSTAPVTQSALAIVMEADPDDTAAYEGLQKIQDIRRRYDKAYLRWPPHINVLWPFYPSGYFDQVIKRITEDTRFKAIGPFDVRL